MWKAKGDSGFEKQIDKTFDTTAYLIDCIKKHPHFRLVMPEVNTLNGDLL